MNEPAAHDRDFSDGFFSFHMDPQRPVAWQPTINNIYVLMLDHGRDWFNSPAEFIATHPQIGFEVTEEYDRVTPIIKGGELDVYAGRTVEELAQIIGTGNTK